MNKKKLFTILFSRLYSTTLHNTTAPVVVVLHTQSSFCLNKKSLDDRLVFVYSWMMMMVVIRVFGVKVKSREIEKENDETYETNEEELFKIILI